MKTTHRKTTRSNLRMINTATMANSQLVCCFEAFRI